MVLIHVMVIGLIQAQLVVVVDRLGNTRQLVVVQEPGLLELLQVVEVHPVRERLVGVLLVLRMLLVQLFPFAHRLVPAQMPAMLEMEVVTQFRLELDVSYSYVLVLQAIQQEVLVQLIHVAL